MSLRKKQAEIHRLRDAFEIEAAKFHDLRLSTFSVAKGEALSDNKFSSPHHAISLWQYYGSNASESDVQQLVKNLRESDPKWGVRGAETSLFAVLEGSSCELFVRMAKRAGSLFNEKEARNIKSRVLGDIMKGAHGESQSAKPIGVINDNALAVWLNFLLYHLSLTNPGRERSQRIEPDPYSLSLLALERLATDLTIGKIDRSSRRLQEIKFRVAMSFAGEKRAYVAGVVDALRSTLGEDAIFYDYDYQAQLARPNLDTLLQDIYRSGSDLVVVFLCKEYSQKEWCGLEWRAIRDIIKSRDGERVMLIRFDNEPVDGIFSIDGYIDGNKFNATEVAGLIADRLASIPATTA